MPKRGASAVSLLDADQLRDLAFSNPMQAVAELPYLHPSVDMALSTAKHLMFPECGVTIKAYAEGSPEPDEAGSASLDAMWDAQPPECGGSLQGAFLIQAVGALLTGMPCVEAVPSAEPLGGVHRVHPVDSLSVGFGRHGRDADLTAYQFQRWPVSSGTQPNGPGYQWQPLDMRTFFWRGIDQTDRQPEGKSPYATAVTEVIADLALMQDLRDAVHNAAWPRMEVGVNLTALHKVAVEVYRMTNPKRAAEWVTERFNDTVAYVSSLNSDDNVVHDSTGDVRTLEPGSFQGLEGVLSFLRQRIAQSLKTLPTLLGINDGSTFNYTSVEYMIYTSHLEAVRSLIVQIMVDVSNLHLRLVGSKSVAKASYEKMRTNDKQVDANTLSTTITNANNLEKLGYITHDEGAQMCVGHDAVVPAQPGVIEPLPTAPPGGGPADGGTRNGGPGPHNLPGQGNNEGTTKEDRATKKDTETTKKKAA